MKELFNIDFNNYNPDGKVFSRTSVRAIIYQNGKLLLVYSPKYNYYKFPGGGIEKGELPEEALVREVREETGYQVIPGTIEEYGMVMRRQKDSYDENAIFEQPNFYYFCSVSDEQAGSQLDDYEEDEGFTPVWVEAAEASRHNKAENHGGRPNQTMIKRDTRVLDMVDLEIRQREKSEKERY